MGMPSLVSRDYGTLRLFYPSESVLTSVKRLTGYGCMRREWSLRSMASKRPVAHDIAHRPRRLVEVWMLHRRRVGLWSHVLRSHRHGAHVMAARRLCEEDTNLARVRVEAEHREPSGGKALWGSVTVQERGILPHGRDGGGRAQRCPPMAAARRGADPSTARGGRGAKRQLGRRGSHRRRHGRASGGGRGAHIVVGGSPVLRRTAGGPSPFTRHDCEGALLGREAQRL